ncbi:hypothetical protein E4U43_000385 [Claviceps pusilla]|uniref:RRM domain-containing protein n=1 Tax=Claviceps pusilla TaxID=123648 RepID=A0A9P7N9I9_9HYPO|nr:hypothetical protein E4U43_000385 [Claviceps pusilla]
MSRQGGPEKKVIMTDVEPGEKTGIYYMPICNLPFGTSWQDFKDWLRVDCDVDHVELFQSSTSGWIRLRGEKNFNKAWTRLKKEYFRNRAIIASDKNRTESIKVKELVDSRVAQFGTPIRWEMAASQAHHPDAILLPTSSCMQEPVSLTSPLSSDRDFGRLPASISCPVGSVGPVAVAKSIAYGGMTVLDPYTTMPETYNALAAARNHALAYAPAFAYYESPPPDTSGLMPAAHFSNSSSYSSSYGATQSPLDTQYLPSHQSHPSTMPYRSTPGTPIHAAPVGASPSHQGGLAYAVEEACKVVVTSIQHKSRPSEVSNWIRHQIGEYSPAIMGMDIPLAEPKGRLRGHAYIALANSTAAEATVRILDQKLFQGRVVSARILPSEGFTDAERSNPLKEVRTPRHNRSEQGKPVKYASADEPGKPPGRADMVSRTLKPSYREAPTPTPHASHSPRGKEGEEQVRRYPETNHVAGPVVAYGSSTRKTDKTPLLVTLRQKVPARQV